MKLYSHPLASFCWKVLIALHESEARFDAVVVDFGNPDDVAKLNAMWSVGKIPVLDDGARGIVPETSIIIEHLNRVKPARVPLIPSEFAAALQARLWDRFFDCYVHAPMQKLVTDLRRGEGEHDAKGVDEARALITAAYAQADTHLADKTWACGSDFSIADCSALPALFYASTLVPLEGHNLERYFDRLCARPSVVKTIKGAQPYFQYYPASERIPKRFLNPHAESFATHGR